MVQNIYSVLFYFYDEVIRSESMSELDLTSYPVIPDLEKQVITVDPPTLTDHEPQTSKTFIPQGKYVVDEEEEEEAKKSLRTILCILQNLAT